MRLPPDIVIGGLCLVLIVLAGACSQSSSTMNDDAPSTATLPTRATESASDLQHAAPASRGTSEPQPTATTAAFTFPTQPPGSASAMALAQGRLFDAGGCLWITLDGGMSYGIVWPYGYSSRDADGVREVLDARGAVVARVGESVEMAGGEAGVGDMGCLGAGRIWIAAEPVHPTN